MADSVRADMKKVSDYKLIVFAKYEPVAETVNALIREQGYELYGPPFGSANSYGQALVKYEQEVPEEMPTTLEQKGWSDCGFPQTFDYFPRTSRRDTIDAIPSVQVGS